MCCTSGRMSESLRQARAHSVATTRHLQALGCSPQCPFQLKSLCSAAQDRRAVSAHVPPDAQFTNGGPDIVSDQTKTALARDAICEGTRISRRVVGIRLPAVTAVQPL